MYYRKYRPQKFSELVGVEHIKTSLLSQIKQDKFSHAYLFVGPRGTGKTTVARLLAKSLNCLKPTSGGEPCGKCRMCVSVREGRFLDLIEIDAASNRGIDDIRELREGVKLAPNEGKYKVYIIDEVHMLTTEAFNALLKTLEEPPSHSVFILATTDARKVPETIKSRCQFYEFKRAVIKEIVAFLDHIAKEEKVKVKDEDLRHIAKAAKGSFRDAATMLEQVVVSGLSVDKVVVSSDTESYSEFLSFIMGGDSAGAIKLVNDLYESGADLQAFCQGFLFYVRDVLLVKVGQADLVNVTDEALEDLRGFADRLNERHIIKLLDVFSKAQQEFRYAATPQLPLEVAVISLLTVGNKEHPGVNESKKKDDGVNAAKPAERQKVSEVKPKEIKGSDDSANNSDSAHNPHNPVKTDLTLETIQTAWGSVVEKVSRVNSSLASIVRTVKPVELDGGTLTLNVYYSFHKERIEALRNKDLLESVLREMGGDYKIKCVLFDGEKPRNGSYNKSVKIESQAEKNGDLIDANIKPVELDIEDLEKFFEE